MDELPPNWLEEQFIRSVELLEKSPYRSKWYEEHRWDCLVHYAKLKDEINGK